MHDIPITVYRGYRGPSLSLPTRCRRFRPFRKSPGEVYNIGGDDFHSIEEVADLIIKHLGKEGQRDKLIQMKDEEMLTTREKKADCSKARRDLNLKSTVSLDDGIQQTIAWMKKVYGNR
jgi:dTDP-glucose 4,6-dehydratase